jgi:hypothetical protein
MAMVMGGLPVGGGVGAMGDPESLPPHFDAAIAQRAMPMATHFERI